MNQIFGICNLSLVPLRAEPSDKSEMISQLLFGEHFEVLEITEKWTRIQTAFDDYQGWMDVKQFVPISKDSYYHLNKQQPVLGLQPVHPVIKKSNGERLYLVAGSSIPGYNEGTCSIGSEIFSLAEAPVQADAALFEENVIKTARFYLNSPYLWGGRSIFGIDCSGFSQMVFKQCGIPLQRDAWQQALQGETVDFLQETKAGDLAFFDNAEGRIIHVGIMLDNEHIIHASGRVKVDTIDTEGIYSADLKRYTHKLRIIRRYR